jgi:preprotein translocase subunit YajC
MLIDTAMAASEAVGEASKTPAAGETFMLNMGLILVMVILFYVLLIRPQKQRYREHANMLSGLQKGDKVVTQGGLVATIHKIRDNGELVVDLGDNMRVTLLRNSVSSKYETAQSGNDNKPDNTASDDTAIDNE